MTVFDRSWYGRVLVERVEELRDAVSSGSGRMATIVGLRALVLRSRAAMLVKFWIHVSAEEQLHRFKKREHESAEAAGS